MTSVEAGVEGLKFSFSFLLILYAIKSYSRAQLDCFLSELNSLRNRLVRFAHEKNLAQSPEYKALWLFLDGASRTAHKWSLPALLLMPANAEYLVRPPGNSEESFRLILADFWKLTTQYLIIESLPICFIAFPLLFLVRLGIPEIEEVLAEKMSFRFSKRIESYFA